MTKKDNEKDSDRPHYYSQFWLDIAAGRRTIGGPRSDEDEPLDDLPEPVAPPRRSARNGQEHSSAFDGLREHHYEEDEAPVETPRVRATVEPVAIHEEVNEPELEQEPEAADLAAAEIGDLDLQEAAVEDADIPDMDLEEPVEEEDEEFFDEDEDEEEDEWSAGRGRKKAKPTRPTKPVIKQRPRREPRRGF